MLDPAKRRTRLRRVSPSPRHLSSGAINPSPSQKSRMIPMMLWRLGSFKPNMFQMYLNPLGFPGSDNWALLVKIWIKGLPASIWFSISMRHVFHFLRCKWMFSTLRNVFHLLTAHALSRDQAMKDTLFLSCLATRFRRRTESTRGNTPIPFPVAVSWLSVCFATKLFSSVMVQIVESPLHKSKSFQHLFNSFDEWWWRSSTRRF